MVTGPELTSPRAPRVKAAQRLAKRAFRARDRRFLAEGPQAVREATLRPGTVLELFATADAGLEGVEIPYVPTRPASYTRLRIDSGRLVQILADGRARGDFTELTLSAR